MNSTRPCVSSVLQMVWQCWRETGRALGLDLGLIAHFNERDERGGFGEVREVGVSCCGHRDRRTTLRSAGRRGAREEKRSGQRARAPEYAIVSRLGHQ